MRENHQVTRIGFFKRKRRSGQALLEFALALPILLMVIFAIIDFALLFQAWLSVENMARQTVRYAVTGEYNTADCVDGPDAGSDPCFGDGEDAEQDVARLVSIHRFADNWSVGLFRDNAAAISAAGFFKLTVCSTRDADGNLVPDYTVVLPAMGPHYASCLLGATPTEDAGGPGDHVYVMVDFNHPYITPFIHAVWPWVHLGLLSRRDRGEFPCSVCDRRAAAIECPHQHSAHRHPRADQYGHSLSSSHGHGVLYPIAVSDTYFQPNAISDSHNKLCNVLLQFRLDPDYLDQLWHYAAAHAYHHPQQQLSGCLCPEPHLYLDCL